MTASDLIYEELDPADRFYSPKNVLTKTRVSKAPIAQPMPALGSVGIARG